MQACLQGWGTCTRVTWAKRLSLPLFPGGGGNSPTEDRGATKPLEDMTLDDLEELADEEDVRILQQYRWAVFEKLNMT